MVRVGDSSAQLNARRAAAYDRVIAPVAAFVLSIAAFVSSYAGVQIKLWDGQRLAANARAESLRINATESSMISMQTRTVDVILFTEWLNASAAGDRRLQDYYRSRFRPAFRQAFDEWQRTRPEDNPDAPPSPLAMPSFRNAADREAQTLDRGAESASLDAVRARAAADGYVQSTIALSLSLFLAGMVQAFNTVWLRSLLLSVAALSLVFGIVRVLALPALKITL